LSKNPGTAFRGKAPGRRPWRRRKNEIWINVNTQNLQQFLLERTFDINREEENREENGSGRKIKSLRRPTFL